jgi:integrase
MTRISTTFEVLDGSGRPDGRTPLESAYDHFRLERQGNLCSPATLEHYDYMVLPFLRWVREQRPEVRRPGELEVQVLRLYRAYLTSRPTRSGRPLRPDSIRDSHRALLTFFRWSRAEGYELDPRIFELRRPKVPIQEPTVYHITLVRKILPACNSRLPQEEMAVRILLGSGVRASELCGLAVYGPDGLPDVMLDSISRGRAELRVRREAGAQGRKSRRVPIMPKLAAAIKRHEARHRPETDSQALLLSERGGPYDRFGVISMMDRLSRRTGIRVHAHGFRHTFGVVATKLGWNFEHLRAAMGHSARTPPCSSSDGPATPTSSRSSSTSASYGGSWPVSSRGRAVSRVRCPGRPG